jgi:hypothetical protein
LRENIHKENLDHHSLFYKTDHHWKAETGLWAAGIIAQHLNENNGFTINLDTFHPEQYQYNIYKDWFLGSLGKKVTLVRTPPEDFTLIYPKFDTDISLKIPEIYIDARGNFDVFIWPDMIKIKDYYNRNPYGAYYGDRQLITVHNNLLNDGKSVLLVKDSFVNVVAPFLSMGIEDLNILDLRHFNGSIKSYVKTNKPDVIVVMYNPGALDYMDGHKKLFDFR